MNSLHCWAAPAWPLAARAQQPTKIARIGLMATSSSEIQMTADAFRQGLRELGYVEGTNILVEYRTADGKIERFPELLNELIRLNVDVIVAPNTPAARAAQLATTTIPIVVPVMGDPAGDGLVSSLPRPGGNITASQWSNFASNGRE